MLSTSNSPRLLFPFISCQNPILSLLEASSCNTIAKMKQAHTLLLTSGLSLHPFPPSKLLQLLLSLPLSPPLLSYAQLLFHRSPSPPLFSYNSLIKAYSNSFSLHLFRSLLRDAFAPLPNQYTLTFVLAACRPDSGLELSEAEQVRAHAFRRGFETNLFVSNVLIKMYGDWGLTDHAEKVFDGCSHRDLFSWNLMVGVHVGSGDVEGARKVFDEMPDRDVVSWSTVIAGYVQTGLFLEAMLLFQKMQLAGVWPNEFTLSTILAACANLVALDQGRWIHAFMNKARIKVNDRLLASLIDMYAKCGEIGFALDLFNRADSPKQTVRPWNAILTGLAIHGCSAEATQLFERMTQVDVVPDKVTFVSLLTACSHGRLVEKGKLYFDMMQRTYTIEPELEHYGCMVDLLSRAGLLEEAEYIVSNMPMLPDAATWGSLLSACRVHKDVERGERIGKLVEELEPKHVGCHVLLANVYCGYGRWNDAKDVREKIEMAGERKIPGCSSIEVDGMFHQFLVGDRSHPQTQYIYSFLDEMAIKLKSAGYVPEVGEVLIDVDVEDKETALSRHSEKLAIAFGLLNTRPRTPIRIVKNLRVCVDCHHAMKFISKVYEREIIVRDRVRFHLFKDGSCSCGDYW